MRKPFLHLCTFALLLPLFFQSLVFAGSDAGVVRGGLPRFTLEQAILTALQRNADIQRAKQEIERAKGVYLELRADALPRIDAGGTFLDTDPHLGRSNGDGGGPNVVREASYNFSLRATQIVFAGGRVVSQIKSSEFLRDSAYFAFRDTIDTVVAQVRQQFYLVLLNRALIGVQEESVNLLRSQLEDQQNRFDAGTVPRFNVLQAQVALSNQYPELIRARNDYQIAALALAKTIGLDFDPVRGGGLPFEAVGELRYVARNIPLPTAIELAKDRRPLLKQQKANVLASNAQVGIARAGYFPEIRATGGSDFRSSPLSTDINDVRSGYVFGANGTWAIWDWGQTYGRVKQARALREQAKITLDDANRQVELEVQTAYSNMIQSRELIRSQEQTVGQAQEALRLASARLSAGAGTQLEVLNARVEVTRALSISFQALYAYNNAVAEFDRATASEVRYANELDEPATRDRVKSEARPTPPPKPTPLPLNRAGNRQPVSTTRSGGGK